MSETDGTLAPTEAALLVSSNNFAIQTDNGAGLLTTRLQINGGTNAGTFTLGDANADTLNMGIDVTAAVDTINLLTGADGTADVFNLGGTGADDINIGSATSLVSITSTQLNVADTGDISDAGGAVVIADTEFTVGTAGADTITLTSTGGDTINIGTDNTNADTITIGSVIDMFTISSAQLSIASTGDISDAGGDVTINDALTVTGMLSDSDSEFIVNDAFVFGGGPTVVASVAGNMVLSDTTTNVFEISGSNAITNIGWGASTTAAPAGTIIFLTFITDADLVDDDSEDATDGELFLNGDLNADAADTSNRDTITLISNGHDWWELARSDND
jgi:hypothetical protein